MSQTDVIGAARSFAPRVWILGLAGLVILALAVAAPDGRHRLIAMAAGLTLMGMGLLVRGIAAYGSARARRGEAQIATLIANDPTPCFTTDALGQIGYQNAAAEQRFGRRSGSMLVAALSDHFASPGSVLYRLQGKAASRRAAREDVVTRHGHTRLSVHAIGRGSFLWRLEEFRDPPQKSRSGERLSLPMLVANKAGVILFANDALRETVGGRPRLLDNVFLTPHLRNGEEVTIAGINGPLRAILAEIEGEGDRREIYLMPVPEAAATLVQMADFESLPVALMTFTTGGDLIAANKAARDQVSLKPEEQVAFFDLFEGLGRSVTDWLIDVATERSPAGAEVLRLRREEEDVYLQITLRRVVDQGRASVIAVLIDATAMKTLEAQFNQSQKMQAVGQLAGGIAHDFNNLLTAISGHCDLLLLRHDAGDPEYADLVQIHQNANRAASLVGQLLAFSRKQTLKPERLDLQEVLSDLTHLLNRLVGERVSLKLIHAPDLGPVRADKRQLEQVLMNLVVNARDAMQSGGVIRIETDRLELKEELCRDRAIMSAGNYAVIRVIDTGIGIPPERITKIFEPFFTTKRVGEGTGLGLSTVYGIIKQSGGFIFVDSEPGAGSVFHFYLPLHEGEEIVEVIAPPRVVLRQGEGVILLVEDEAPVRAFASRALRLRGYTVLEAQDAEEALQTLADPALVVDVFVTDVIMPGMDGPSWVRIALQDRPNVRVIFMSGYAEESFPDSQTRIPNSVFLPKPFSLNDLTMTVQEQLH